MPELAEVEFQRKRWDCGIRRKVLRVDAHTEKRIFRDGEGAVLTERLSGAQLLGSEARAKLMLFRFSKAVWMGVHLGMSGELRIEPPDFSPGRHDHLVLFQKEQSLVFRDPRMFGRIRVHIGEEPPSWWTELPPAILSEEWTMERMREFFRRHGRLAIKAALLNQTMFPGVGNWMADEILWRARLAPARLCSELTPKQSAALWQETREVCRIALETVAVDYADPPSDWFFHQRWSRDGVCPRDGLPLETATIGGRTTRWCRRCQKS